MAQFATILATRYDGKHGHGKIDSFEIGNGPYLDYLNFHFYNGGRDPSRSYGSVPSFNQWWQTIHQIATKYGYANKPIWVTEVGWPTHPTIHPEQPVAPDVQAQSLP